MNRIYSIHTSLVLVLMTQPGLGQEDQYGFAGAVPAPSATAGKVYSKEQGAVFSRTKESFRVLQDMSYRPSVVLVRFRPDLDLTSRDDVHNLVGISAVDTEFDDLVPGLVRVVVPAGAEQDAIHRYLDDPDVLYAEPEYIPTPTAIPNDPEWDELWGMKRIRVHDAWDVTQGSDFKVAIIDSGINLNHPDLVGNIWTNPGEMPDNGIDDDGNGYIDDIHGWNTCVPLHDPGNGNVFDEGSFHGSHVAGTIGAVGNNGEGVVGVNWSVQIVAVKTLCDEGSPLNALKYVKDNDIKLSNNSWGYMDVNHCPVEGSQAVKDAIENMQSMGHIFVASAGNGGCDGKGDNNDAVPHYPSGWPLDNVIAVANHGDDNELAESSNYGLVSVDLAAPGSEILSTLEGSGYGNKSGTSMAAPHVTGAIALTWARFPDLTWRQVRDCVLSSVVYEPALDGKVATAGRLDAARPTGVWVQIGGDGRWGTRSSPYSTVAEALPWVPVHGRLFIEQGVSSWTGTIAKAMVIEAANGQVVLGFNP